MNVSMFSKLRRVGDIQNMLELVNAVEEEHGGHQSQSLFAVDAGDGNKLRYIGSTAKADAVLYHYFTGESGDGLRCIDRVKPGGGLEKLSGYDYLSFELVAGAAVRAVTQDGLSDLFVDGKRVCRGVAKVDLLTLGSILFFIQLDFPDVRSLVCVDEYNRVFLPKDADDFHDYFVSRVRQYGYEGHLDMIPVSHLIQIYYEVRNCIFASASYRQVGEWCE